MGSSQDSNHHDRLTVQACVLSVQPLFRMCSYVLIPYTPVGRGPWADENLKSTAFGRLACLLWSTAILVELIIQAEWHWRVLACLSVSISLSIWLIVSMFVYVRNAMCFVQLCWREQRAIIIIRLTKVGSGMGCCIVKFIQRSLSGVISTYIATQQQDSSFSLSTLVYRPWPTSGLS